MRVPKEFWEGTKNYASAIVSASGYQVILSGFSLSDFSISGF
jgi:hypothetical protein